MRENDRVREDRAVWKTKISRLFGSAPWMRANDVRHYRAKVFKSGNSLALRLPAGVGLSAGQEMELRAENNAYFTFEPVERTPRRFNIDKVWGSASGLEFIKPEDRLFKERNLIGGDQDDSVKAGDAE